MIFHIVQDPLHPGDAVPQYHWKQPYNSIQSWQTASPNAPMPRRDIQQGLYTPRRPSDVLYSAPQRQHSYWPGEEENRQTSNSYDPWGGASDPSWQPVGLPMVRNDKGRLQAAEKPGYLCIDASELGAQRAATQNLINAKCHKDQSTLKVMQVFMTRLISVRTNAEVNQRNLFSYTR